MAGKAQQQPQDPFIQRLLATLSPLLPIQARAMFGGWGIYHDGLMFGLVAKGDLYLKTDDHNRGTFVSAGLPPFTYDRKGKPAAVMSYHLAPPILLDQPLEEREWLDGAVAAAKRASAKKNKLRPSL